MKSAATYEGLQAEEEFAQLPNLLLPLSEPLEEVPELRSISPGALPFISFSFENSLSKFSRSPSLVVRLASSWMSISSMGSEIQVG